jgi:glycerophosphoryl diester phosphodiesterase
MKIIAHRGWWEQRPQMNTPEAFEKALSSGFGIETDLRDHNGEIVISHDMPTGNEISLQHFFEIYNKCGAVTCLALNIKADGLQKSLKKLIEKYNIGNYFVFDMSVPDFRLYIQEGIKSFTRKSEYETVPSFLNESKGIWLDEFIGNWLSLDELKKLSALNESLCIVSPELHGRAYDKEWEVYRKFEGTTNTELIICTDFPEKARRYFNEKN